MIKTGNQDNPIYEGTEMIPIIALDIWEHAYYLKYKNLRADYIKGLFERCLAGARLVRGMRR